MYLNACNIIITIIYKRKLDFCNKLIVEFILLILMLMNLNKNFKIYKLKNKNIIYSIKRCYIYGWLTMTRSPTQG